MSGRPSCGSSRRTPVSRSTRSRGAVRRSGAGDHRRRPPVRPIRVACSDITYVRESGLVPERVQIRTVGRLSYRRATCSPRSGNPVPGWSGLWYTDDLISGINPRLPRRRRAGRFDGCARWSRGRGGDDPVFGQRRPAFAGSRPSASGSASSRVPMGRVNWRLWAGPDDPPRRFTASIVRDMTGSGKPNWTVNSTTFYKRWATAPRSRRFTQTAAGRCTWVPRGGTSGHAQVGERAPQAGLLSRAPLPRAEPFGQRVVASARNAVAEITAR